MAEDDVNSNEQAYLEELRQTKEHALHEYDLQAEHLGPFTPPYIHLERKRLREELGIVKKVIASPLGANLGDELGEKNRFVGYLTEIQTVGHSVERLEARFAHFVEDSVDWRGRISFRVLALAVLVIIFVVVVIVMALIGVYWLGKFAGDQSFVQDVFAFVWR